VYFTKEGKEETFEASIPVTKELKEWANA